MNGRNTRDGRRSNRAVIAAMASGLLVLGLAACQTPSNSVAPVEPAPQVAPAPPAGVDRTLPADRVETLLIARDKKLRTLTQGMSADRIEDWMSAPVPVSTSSTTGRAPGGLGDDLPRGIE